MGKTPSYFIVEADALPEVFLKVAQAKQMLETGEYTPEEAISEIEKDNAIDAQQKGVAGW